MCGGTRAACRQAAARRRVSRGGPLLQGVAHRRAWERHGRLGRHEQTCLESVGHCRCAECVGRGRRKHITNGTHMPDDLATRDSAPAATAPFEAKALEASLTVIDPKRSAGWYRDVLGFTIDKEYERGGRLIAIALRAGTVRMLL